jgi:murein DD-endopeptidase MepM/ murein hydrolase activator NlpD
MRHLRFLPLGSLALLVACSITNNQATPSQPPSLSPTAFLPSETATPMLELAGPPTQQTSSILPPIEPPPRTTPTPGAIQLYFPTVIPAEGAEYRPPLYPTPWALSPHDHFYFASPIAASYPGQPEWDYRYGGIFFKPDVIHTGIDIPAPEGTNVMAAGSGTVVWAGIGLFSGSKLDLNDPYGLAVAIRHDFGWHDKALYTVYAHLQEVDVLVGQWLNTGDVLGNVGSTGMTTGPHLHFEVRLGENDFFYTRNPELWLSPPIGDGVLVGRVTSTYGTILNSYLVSLKSLDTEKFYTAYTYGPQVVNSDEYYFENVVISNLPAGVYELNIPYGALNRTTNIQILPGQVTYFSFHGYSLFDTNLPDITPTPTP